MRTERGLTNVLQTKDDLDLAYTPDKKRTGTLEQTKQLQMA